MDKYLFRNIKYEDVRLSIRSVDSMMVNREYITEGSGSRYYVNEIGSTVRSLESATFEGFLSFKTKGNISWTRLDLIPMAPNNTCFVEIKAIAVNSNTSQAMIKKVYGGFRHNGTSIVEIGGNGSLITDKISDFVLDAATDFNIILLADNLIRLEFLSEFDVDWDVHIKYTKGFHGSGAGDKPIYPIYNDAVTI